MALRLRHFQRKPTRIAAGALGVRRAVRLTRNNGILRSLTAGFLVLGVLVGHEAFQPVSSQNSSARRPLVGKYQVVHGLADPSRKRDAGDRLSRVRGFS